MNDFRTNNIIVIFGLKLDNDLYEWNIHIYIHRSAFSPIWNGCATVGTNTAGFVVWLNSKNRVFNLDTDKQKFEPSFGFVRMLLLYVWLPFAVYVPFH